MKYVLICQHSYSNYSNYSHWCKSLYHIANINILDLNEWIELPSPLKINTYMFIKDDLIYYHSQQECLVFKVKEINKVN